MFVVRKVENGQKATLEMLLFDSKLFHERTVDKEKEMVLNIQIREIVLQKESVARFGKKSNEEILMR